MRRGLGLPLVLWLGKLSRIRMYGRVKYLDNVNEIHREIVPWEMNAADVLSILETISK